MKDFQPAPIYPSHRYRHEKHMRLLQKRSCFFNNLNNFLNYIEWMQLRWCCSAKMSVYVLCLSIWGLCSYIYLDKRTCPQKSFSLVHPSQLQKKMRLTASCWCWHATVFLSLSPSLSRRKCRGFWLQGNDLNKHVALRDEVIQW